MTKQEFKQKSNKQLDIRKKHYEEIFKYQEKIESILNEISKIDINIGNLIDEYENNEVSDEK